MKSTLVPWLQLHACMRHLGNVPILHPVLPPGQQLLGCMAAASTSTEAMC
jgi:hypothetical protein